jgi:branched-chain amino acid transport system substrate-binding protein
MSQKNETLILILTLAIVVGLLGGGVWLLRNLLNGENSISSNNANNSGGLVNRLSEGDRLLILADKTPEKEAGIKAFAEKNFTVAQENFSASLKTQHNDPEAIIYLNNAKAATKNPFKLATSIPIGSNPNVAREILRGVAQAQNEINAKGGLKGRMLSIIIANDDNNIELAKQIAKNFVGDTEVLGVIGHNSSNATIAAATEYQQGGLVAISPTSDAKQISGISSYVFRTIPSVRFQADTLSRYAIKTTRKKNLGICFDSTAQYSQSLKDELTSSVFADGGKIVEIDCNFSATSFNANNIVSAAIAKGVDSIVLLPSVDRLNSAIEIAIANQGRVTLFGSSTAYTFQTLEQGQNAVNGTILAVPWHPQVFENNDFANKAKALWGGEVNWRTALAYDATEALLTGLERGGFERTNLQKTLSNSNFSLNGASGKIEFLPSGDRNSPAILVKIEPGKKSGTGYDFVPLP